MITEKINIAIDGFSSCGKGTLARYLASELGYIFIDTGSMYRAVAWYFMENHLNPDDENDVKNALSEIQLSFIQASNDFSHISLNGRDIEKEIRNNEVASVASKVAAIPAIRKFLVIQQQEIAAQKGVVMDGRDIGTVVIPNAEVKIFMTALPEIRAQRRYEELERAGVKTTYEDVRRNIQERDERDSKRDDSPLTFGKDYHLLDNSYLSVEQQNEIAMAWVKSSRPLY